MKRKKIVFLGGPIQQAIDRDGKFNGDLKDQILCLILTLKNLGYEVLSAHLTEDFGALTPNDDSDEITARDYRWMQLCDVYMAIFFKNEHNNHIRSDGTHIEIGWASAMGKPVILIGDDISSEQNSHLVRGLGAVTYVQYIELAKTQIDHNNLADFVQSAMSMVFYD